MISRKKDDARLLQERSLQAALMAVERLTGLLSDPEASNADVLKAATLIFEKIHVGGGPGAAAGDFEICVKED